MKKRVTQKEVAKEAGVSHVAVSLALRGHHSISAGTRQRIVTVAEKLGYVPDPMLSGLAAYRMTRRSYAYQANIGWINSWNPPTLFAAGDFMEYFEGAASRCSQLGYKLEEIRLAEFDFDMKSVRKSLLAQGISALLLAPHPQPGAHCDLDFSNFSAVRIGYSYTTPQLHVVTNAQFLTAKASVERATALGYRRIGVLYQGDIQNRTGGNFQGGFHVATQKLPEENRVEPLWLKSSTGTVKTIRKWLKAERVDCVISHGHIPEFTPLGVGDPEGIGFVSLDVTVHSAEDTGMWQNSSLVGVSAVNFLVGMLQRGEVGVPEVPTHIYTESTWRQGKTTRPAPVELTV